QSRTETSLRSVKSRFAFVETINDSAGTGLPSDCFPNTCDYAGKTSCVAYLNLPDCHRISRSDSPAVALSLVAESQADRAYSAAQPAEGHSQASGRDDDQSRFARVAGAVCARRYLRIWLSRLLGQVRRGSKSKVSGTELQGPSQSTSF